jgi:serine/threonine-protein kinase HipA
MRQAEIKFNNKRAGILIENEDGYSFVYDNNYLNSIEAVAISKTLPLQKDAFKSNILFPFFDGLIPEGWLLDIAERNWKLNARDRMGLLLACCKDCIGAVSVHQITQQGDE